MFGGCSSSTSSSKVLDAAKEPPASSSLEVLIYADEAMLRKPYAVIGGLVENVSGSRLEDVSLEMELERRSDGTKERRSVSISPKDLAPGERGAYSLKIRSEEWSDSRIVTLRSQKRQREIVFRTLPGARRPPERIPASPVNKPVEAPRAKKKSGNEEFINTPDNPIAVP